MEFQAIKEKTIALKAAYDNLRRARGEKPWLTNDYIDGLMGDIGDLSKLLVRRRRQGAGATVNRAIAKELGDAFYMIIALSHELGIDLEKEYKINLEFLETRLEELKDEEL